MEISELTYERFNFIFHLFIHFIVTYSLRKKCSGTALILDRTISILVGWPYYTHKEGVLFSKIRSFRSLTAQNEYFPARPARVRRGVVHVRAQYLENSPEVILSSFKPTSIHIPMGRHVLQN